MSNYPEMDSWKWQQHFGQIVSDAEVEKAEFILEAIKQIKFHVMHVFANKAIASGLEFNESEAKAMLDECVDEILYHPCKRAEIMIERGRHD